MSLAGREFTGAQAKELFIALDEGQTRAQLRVTIQEMQDRGISNAWFQRLRAEHRRDRRAGGLPVGELGKRDLLNPFGELKQPRDFPAAERIPFGRYPKPPDLPGGRVTAAYYDSEGGRRVDTFTIGEGPDDTIRAQIDRARVEEGYGSPAEKAVADLAAFENLGADDYMVVKYESALAPT